MKGTGPDRDRTIATQRPWEAVFYPGDNVWRIVHKLPHNTIIVGFVADEGDAKLICEAINTRAVSPGPNRDDFALLVSVAKRFRDGFDYNPGHSDLDGEQPIHISVTLRDWRELNYALRDYSRAATSESGK